MQQVQSSNWHVLDALKFLPEQISEWCLNRGAFFVSPAPKQWAGGEPIVVSSALRTLRIAIVGPHALGTVGKAYGTCGLRLGKDLLGFWPNEGWKKVNRLYLEKIVDFEAYVSGQLEAIFGPRRYGSS
jgi:hypothetical protein